MPDRVQGPAYYFPSIEKKYGQPISYWLQDQRNYYQTQMFGYTPYTYPHPLIGMGGGTAPSFSPGINLQR